MNILRLRFEKGAISILDYGEPEATKVIATFSEVWRVLRELRNINAGEPYSPCICAGNETLGIAKEGENINFLFLDASGTQYYARGTIKTSDLPRILQFYEAPKYLEYDECSLGGGKVG